MTEMTMDMIYNINAFRMWVAKKPDRSNVVGTPEQALRKMYNDNAELKLTKEDKIDIYMLLHNNKFMSNDKNDDYDYEKLLTSESSILEYYNISEVCVYNAKKWVKENRPDIIDLCDKQTDLFGDIKVKTVEAIKPKEPKKTSRVKDAPKRSIMDQVDMLEFMVI